MRVVLSLYFHLKWRSVAVKKEKLPQSAERETAPVMSFQIRHQEADSSPRPQETTRTKIHTGDLLQNSAWERHSADEKELEAIPRKVSSCTLKSQIKPARP